MEVIFSNIDEDDLAGCSELYVATFREPPWNEKWNEEDAFERLSDFLTGPKSIAIKAVYNGIICGFIFGKIEQYNSATYYNLKEICVSSAVQRKGVGENLVRELEEILRKNGVEKICLITQRDGAPSSFYTSLGFSEIQNMMMMGKPVKKTS